MIPRKTSRVKTRFGGALIGGTLEPKELAMEGIGVCYSPRCGCYVFRKHLWKPDGICRRCGQKKA